MKGQIQILPSAQIDPSRWDRCLNSNTNGLIYSRKKYLDLLCDQWQGLVVDDYKIIMPIPWRKKYGIRYTYIPSFCQQLGITGKMDQQMIQSIREELFHFVTYGDIHFNFGNSHVSDHFTVTAKNNFIIDLSKDIHTIRSYYRNDLKENIRKAAAENLQYEVADVNTAIECFIKHYGKKIRSIGKDDFIRFSKACELFYKEGDGFVRKAASPGGEIFAIALFLKDQKRIYNILNTTLPSGKKKSANHFLLDQVLAEFAGSSLLFDMEGSELPGVRHFYEGFGPLNQPYYHYHFNKFPWPLYLLKR